MSSWTRMDLLVRKAKGDTDLSNKEPLKCLSWLQKNVGVDPRNNCSNFARLARADPEKYNNLILGYVDSPSDPATLAGFGSIIKEEQKRSKLCVEATGFVSLKQYKLDLLAKGGVNDWISFLREFDNLQSTKPAFYDAYNLEAKTYWSQEHKNASLYN